MSSKTKLSVGDRAPLPPDVLAGAKQDTVHVDQGESRPARSVRSDADDFDLQAGGPAMTSKEAFRRLFEATPEDTTPTPPVLDSVWSDEPVERFDIKSGVALSWDLGRGPSRTVQVIRDAEGFSRAERHELVACTGATEVRKADDFLFDVGRMIAPTLSKARAWVAQDLRPAINAHAVAVVRVMRAEKRRVRMARKQRRGWA